MTLTDGLLIVVIVVLIWIVIRGQQKPRGARVNTWDCVNRATGDMTSVRIAASGAGCASGKSKQGLTGPEKQVLSEHNEYFASCTEAPNDINATCGTTDTFPYSINAFGAPGLDYKDWVTSQSVDPQVIKNHAEFVSDRLNGINTQNITGRTWSPSDSYHESYMPLLWQGIRGRPEAVATCNPTQDPDLAEDEYSQKPKLTWSST